MEMRPIVKIFLALNLVAITVLVFKYAELMVSPGKLIFDHRTSEADCFACHTLFLGASSEKCVACHKVDDIGVMTTKGILLEKKKTAVPFHQKLLLQDCVACHSDHMGVAKFRSFQKFSHGLVETSIREKCVSCHQMPADQLHRNVSETCSQCHGTDKWKPATFDHKVLDKAELAQCISCHKAKVPSDKLHSQVSGQCGQCHTTEKWKPATFDHNKFFVFDRDHDVKCEACHTTGDYKKYTCYECHEHSPSKIREEHEEEGIRDFENCVACHRNADEDDAKRAWQSIRRGVPYQFGLPNTENDKKLRKEHDD
ncbi:cytochrome c3 family protein [Magnetovibrio blakemorei]|nr:cytochrome c3 family protein [Magnetovibrio blakemorei]